MSDYINCFGCGAKSLNFEGEVHNYMLSSPGCWAMFCEIMDREFSDIRYWRAHQFTVDAYAASHVGKKEDIRAVNSVNIHLAALYFIFEKGMSLEETPKLRSRFSQYYKGKDQLEWLVPPSSFGDLSIYELWENEVPEMHYPIAENWARSIWEAWSHQHDRVKELVSVIY
jgi:hypothetical protein